jgi:glyoxylase-like metal-dependent hydrolase (beta-lactamase superfamily II)
LFSQIAVGIAMISGVGTANIYLLGNKKRFVFIDSGLFMRTALLLHELEGAGYSISNLQRIVLTHCHCDHIGGVRALAETSRIRVSAHKDDVAFILQQAVIDGPYHNMMIQEQKAMRQLSCNVEHVDELLNDDDTMDIIGGIKVLSVPGHTPGSIALYQETMKALFFGDVIRNNEREGLTAGKPEKFNLDTKQTLKDAKRLLELPIDYALFGHGNPIVYETQKVMDKLSFRLNSKGA